MQRTIREAQIPRRGAFAPLLPAALALLLLPAPQEVAIPAPGTPPVPTAATSEEDSMRVLINAARGAGGRVRLRMNSTLVTVARRHASRMAARGRIYHNPKLASQVRLPWRILGENVGVGQTVSTLHTAFMNSPPHRRNIMDRRFRQVGVGIVHAASRTWIVIVYYA